MTDRIKILGSAGFSKRTRQGFRVIAGRSLAMLLSGLLVFQPMLANAQSVSAAGSAPAANQPGVGTAPNGVPLVDIVTPNATGLSHNKYDNYNVGTPGLILNNFNGEVGTSNLGGVTPGNPNLKTSGPASVILNEVTSGNRSALNGPTEVFGGRADVIIANPNGITCSGCGFINTPRATLTTGVPEIGADGRLTGFAVNGGDVTFKGAGANLAAAPGAVDLFDVVSRQIHVNAPLYGKVIRLTGGASKYDYATGEATALAATSGTPEYAIDGSALGAMQADRIKIVVTEKGAGVMMSGDMAANAGELSLSADGKISIGNASARDGVTITSKHRVTAAKVASKQKVNVQADEGITLQSVAADSDIALVSGAGLISVVEDVTSGTAVQMSSGGGIAAGSVTAGNGAATLVATSGDIVIAGAANSVGDLTLTATAGSLSAASLLSNGNIALNAGLDIAVAGNVLAEGNLTAAGRSVSTGMVVSGIDIAATSADPNGNVVLGSAGNLSLTATGGNIATGNLLSAGALTSTAAGTMTAGSLQSTTDLTVAATSLTSSTVISHGTLTVDASTNVSGQIFGSSNVLISGATIQAGAIVSGVDFAATAAANGNLVVGNAGDMTLQASGSLSADTLLAAGTMFATAADLNVGNVTGHQVVTLSGSSSLTATGQLLGAKEVSISGGSVSLNQVISGLDFAATQANGGNVTLGTTGNLSLQAAGQLSANALLAAGTITATAADLSLGTVTGHNDISLSGGNNLTVTGQTLGANDVSLSGGTISTGQVVTGVDFAAMAQSSTGAIVIGSDGDLTINAVSATNGSLGSATTGALLVAGDLNITAGSFAASNVTGHGAVTVDAAANVSGTLLAAGNVAITGSSITAGSLVSGVDFVATNQSTDGSVVLGSTGTLTLEATAGNINASNLLAAGGIGATASGDIGNITPVNVIAHQNLTMTAGGTIALAGQSMAADSVNLQGQSISVASLVSGVDFAATRASSTGALMLKQGNAQSGTMTLTATNGDITASNALLSGGNLSATTSGGISYALLQSLANASLSAPGTITYTNNSNVTGNLTINTGTIDLSGTRGAKLAVGGTLSITATSANLTGSSLVLGGLALDLSGQADLTGAAVKTAMNAGGSGDIAITAGSLAISDTTTLLAAHDLTLTLPTLSNSGQIAAANNLTINTSGDLTNTSTGLLYAGRDASLLVAGALTNDQGAILAGNDLTIAGSNLSQRNAATTNISGLIQAGGDMSILTSNLVNKRSTTPTWVTGQLVSSGNVVGTFVLNPDVAGKPFAYLETSDQNIHQLYPGVDPPAWQDYEPLLWSQATLADGTSYHAWTWTSANGPTAVGPIYDWIKARVPVDANGTPVLDPTNPSKYFIVDQVIRGGVADLSTTYTWDPTSNLSQSVYEDRFTSTLTPEAVIRSGGNLTIDATNLTNSYSRIEAGGNATLSGSTLTNEGVVLNRTTMTTCNAQSACTAYNADGTADPSRDIANGSSVVSGSQVIGGAAGTLKAAGALTLNFGTVNNTSLGSTSGSAAVSTPSTSSDPLSALSGLTAGGALFTVNSALSNVAGNSVPTAGGGLTAALGNLTQISPANVAQLAALAKPQSGGVGGTIPGQAFIFETRAAFLDVSKFYGSSYFISRAGYDPETSIPFLGDAYFDNQLIDTQLRQLVGDGLGNGSFIPGNSAIEQMKTLLDNGAAYAEAHGLAFGQGLTPEQAANLQQSIVLYQTQTVNGAQVLAPVVYLSAADRAKAGSGAGAMIAGNSVNLNVGDLNNSGAVAAAGGLNIAASSIKSTGTFYAGGNANLTASNGITLAAQTMTIGGQNVVNTNAGVSAGGNLLLAANNSDLNVNGASVKAGGSAQLSGNNVNLAAVKVDNGGQENATGARVTAGSNLAIAANNDVNVIGSSAKSGGDLNIKAVSGAVNVVSTDVARKTNDGYTKTSGTDQQASKLTAGGNLGISGNTGVLISGSDLSAKGDVGLSSNGDINVTTAQSQSASVFGKNSSSSITNNGSTITAGGDLVAKSNNDINVIGSTLAADGILGLQAKNNVTIAEATDGYTLDTKSSSKKSGFFGSTKKDASGHLETTTAAGSTLSGKDGVTIISGGDTTVSASKVTAGDATHSSDLNVQTGGNLIVASAKDTETENDSAKRKGFLRSGSSSYQGYNETTVGSELSASGDVNLDAGKAAVIVGSKVNADGSLNVSGESVSIIGAQENHQSDSQRKDSGLFVGSGGGFISLYGKNEKQGAQSSTDNVGSKLSAGQDVNLTARATDLNIMGSQVTADRDINLSAARDVNVTPGAESAAQSEQQKKSGFGLAFSSGNGGFSLGIGAQSTKDSSAQQSDTNAMSALSAGRDLNISAGNNVNLQATSASAERDVNLFAGNDINLLSANDVTNYEEMHEKTFAGVTLTVSSQVGKAAQSIMNSAERLSDSGGVNAVTNTAIAGLGFYQAYKDLTGVYSQYQKSGDIGVNVTLTVGANHQESQSSSSTSTPVVTDIRAGRSISMEAENGSITSDGAQILAGYDKNGIPTVSGDPLTGDIFLSATNGNINLNAATGTTDSASSNSSWSAAVGVGATFGGGGKGTKDLGLVANAGYGKGSADTSGVSHTNTHVNGTGDITIVTNDLTLRGATITGNSVTADVKNLTIESQVDTAKAKADQLSLSAQTGFGSTSVSGVTQKASGDAVVVTEQSGIHAGAGGLDIDVSGHTSLIGGLITSEAGEGRNSFSTGTLTVADIDTHSTWKADTYGGSIGTSGIVPSPPVKESENKTGQALSAIGGNIPITITDPAHQTQDIGTIRRDTDNTNTSLPGLPDLEHILREQYKTQADLQAAQATMAGLVGDISSNLYKQALQRGDDAAADLWKEGGEGRALLHAIGSGILGGVNGWEGAIKGALGAGTSSLLTPAIAALVKGILKDSTLSDQDKQTLANLIGTSLSSAVAGAVGGGEGASYGGAQYQFNYLTHKELDEANKERADLQKKIANCQASLGNGCSAQTLSDLEDNLQFSVAYYRQLSDANNASLVKACAASFSSAACVAGRADLANAVDEEPGLQQHVLGTSSVNTPDALLLGVLSDVAAGHVASDQIAAQYQQALITHQQITTGVAALAVLVAVGVTVGPEVYAYCAANSAACANTVTELLDCTVTIACTSTAGGVLTATAATKVAGELEQSAAAAAKAAGTRTIVASDGTTVIVPAGYKPLTSAGPAASDVGGLPQGYVRVTDDAGNTVIAGPNSAIYDDVAEAQKAATITANYSGKTDWPELSGALREGSNSAAAALKGEGPINFGMGTFNREQTMAMGEAWVGPGYRVTSRGYYESVDGLRQFRPPSTKTNSQLATTGTQANFEQRSGATGAWGANGHMDVSP